MFFCEKLKALRKSNNLTQEKLADKLNVSRQAITKWESGDGIPDIENLKQISELFGVTIDELIKDDKDVSIIDNRYSFVKEFEIDHSKHFDVKINEICRLNLLPCFEEKVKIEFLTNEEDFNEFFKINFDNLYNRLDINIKNKHNIRNVVINIFLPEKYINDIEINSTMRLLGVSNLNFKKLEYDGALKYLNVNNSKGEVVLNTTKSDIEADYDKFEGSLEVNTINSVARVRIPKGTNYKTILKGKKNEFVDAVNVEESINIIELNGFNSKLIVIEK